jgi:hypothetical protein
VGASAPEYVTGVVKGSTKALSVASFESQVSRGCHTSPVW